MLENAVEGNHTLLYLTMESGLFGFWHHIFSSQLPSSKGPGIPSSQPCLLKLELSPNPLHLRHIQAAAKVPLEDPKPEPPPLEYLLEDPNAPRVDLGDSGDEGKRAIVDGIPKAEFDAVREERDREKARADELQAKLQRLADFVKGLAAGDAPCCSVLCLEEERSNSHWAW